MKRQFCVVVSLCCILLMWSCGDGGSQKTDNTCKGTEDCPGALLCIKGICSVGSLSGGEKQVKEVRAERSPEKVVEPSVEGRLDGESLRELVNDVPGEKPVLDQSGETVEFDAGVPEREPTEGCEEGKKRACSSPCGTGEETCKGNRWEGCTAPSPQTEICNGKDDDCNGKIDEDLSRGCYTGPSGTDAQGLCKPGKQICSSNQWGACVGEVLPEAEKCDRLDNDCDGQVDEGCQCAPGAKQACGKTDVGECSKGAQVCDSKGQWGACSGEVGPQTETCNGKDDDCNGKIDEDLKQACYTGPAGTGGVGVCRSGSQSCVSGRWGTCSGMILPELEKCDKLDNDCDGQVDEGCQCVPGAKQACGTDVGECSKGAQTCDSLGKWGSCVGGTPPRSEICDARDNNCDGKTDEICGLSLDYGLVDSSGRMTRGRGFRSAAKKGTGFYSLSPSQSCTGVPVFARSVTSSTRPVSTYCNNGVPEIRVGAPNTTSGALQDWSFVAVQPLKHRYSAYAYVTGIRCLSTGCGLSGNYGISRVLYRGTGVYDVFAPACNRAYQPVFTTVWSTKIIGFAVASSLGGGTCRVNTYNLSGTPTSLSFAFWAPHHLDHAWVSFDYNGKVLAYNNFGDKSAIYNVSRLTNSSGPYYPVSFTGWSYARGFGFASGIYQGRYDVVSLPSSTGVQVYSHDVASPTKLSPAKYMTVLLGH